ncbi:unnamed protein product, partial [Adineta steineri]
MGKPAVVHVEYCGSFEVTLNNKVIFSKLDTGKFPAFDKVAEEVDNAT